MSSASLACNHCGSPHVNEVPAKPPHHAKAVCVDCGRFVRWLPKPNTTVMPAVTRAPDAPPAALVGTPDQIGAAQSIRNAMAATYRARGRRDVVDVLLSITSAGWFLANRNRSLEEIRWPGPEQLEGAA